MTRLWSRLIANSQVPEDQSEANGCWVWTGAIGNGYPRMNFYVEGHYAQLRAHRVALVLLDLEGQEDYFYEHYLHFSASGLEVDHLCKNPYCVNPNHLVWATGKENLARRDRYVTSQPILRQLVSVSGPTHPNPELDYDLPDFQMTQSRLSSALRTMDVTPAQDAESSQDSQLWVKTA